MNRDITKTEAAQSTDSARKNLYRIGGIAALIVGILTPIDVLFFVIWPQPTTIQGWFALFQKNWVIGLLDLDLLGMIIYVIAVPSILALYFSLRRASQSWIAISTALTFIGIAAYFGSNTIFSMLSLSNQYATASSDAQKSLFLSAGQAVFSIFIGSTFTTSFVVVSLAFLLTSLVMLRSDNFSRRIAYVGIIANLAALGEYVPVLAVVLITGLVNGVGLGLWFILIGLRLLSLAKEKKG